MWGWKCGFFGGGVKAVFYTDIILYVLCDYIKMCHLVGNVIAVSLHY